MEEIWKIIEGTNNRYEVSNYGNIRCENISVPLVVDNTGYIKVRITMSIGTRWFWLHRIVATYFCEGYFLEAQVNHIDGNKENNRAENLEWCTNLENQHHRINILGKDCKGENNPMYGISGEKSPVFKGYILQIDKNTGEVLGKFAGSGEVIKAFPEYKTSGLLKAVNGTNKTYKGYVWRRE